MNEQQNDPSLRRKRHIIDRSDFRNDLPTDIVEEADRLYKNKKEKKADNTSAKNVEK